MKQITLLLKKAEKLNFLMELLAQFDFVEVTSSEDDLVLTPVSPQPYDWFQSAGLFAEREINADELRKQAWRIQK